VVKEKIIIWAICTVTSIGLFPVAWGIGDVHYVERTIPFKDVLFLFGPTHRFGVGSNLGSIGISMFVGVLLPALLPLLTWLYLVRTHNTKT
jgi:hypothetical protein